MNRIYPGQAAYPSQSRTTARARATEADLGKIAAAVARERRPLRGKEAIALRARDGLLFAHFHTKVYAHILRPLVAPGRPNAAPELATAIGVLGQIAVSHIAQARVPTAA